MIKIVQNPDPVLRQTAERITEAEFNSREFGYLVGKLKETLAEEKDGVGLAAPQIGVSKRVFVISPKIFKKPEKHLVYVNPAITKSSNKLLVHDEGCLSVCDIYGKIKRKEKVTVEAYYETGKKFTRGASKLLAEIFQHEIDHFDGKLFIDKAWDLRKIKSEIKD